MLVDILQSIVVLITSFFGETFTGFKGLVDSVNTQVAAYDLALDAHAAVDAHASDLHKAIDAAKGALGTR